MADQTAPSTTTGSAQRRVTLPSLTGLRFLAAMCVFLYHSSYLNDPLRPTMQVSFFGDHDIAKPIADFLEPAGRIGVSFFFILSGFVLTWSATAGERPSAFWRRRALKIYPNHIVTWALAMWLFASSTPVHAYVANLFLVHGFSNRPDTAVSVNFPSWSLCCEMLFYLLFPLFIVLARRISDRRLWWWAVGMIAGVAAVTVVTTQLVSGGVSSPFGNLSANQEWFGYEFPPPRLFEFLFGMMLARIVAAGMWPRIGMLPSAVLFAGGYWAALKVPNPYDFSLTTMVPIGMIICAAAASDVRGDGGWLTSRTMVWLGNVSFAFYLLQALVIFYGRPKVFHAHTYDTIPAIGLWITLLLANLAAAWLLYSLVERPIMRRWARSRKKPTRIAPRTPESVATGEAV
jgi:peptidoglycan/LPS O-acetylase OafA/YrhL